MNPDDDDENQPNAERDVNHFKEAKDRQIRAKKMVSDIKEQIGPNPSKEAVFTYLGLKNEEWL